MLGVRGMTVKHRVSFRGDENVLELAVMVAQCWNILTNHLKGVNFMI